MLAKKNDLTVISIPGALKLIGIITTMFERYLQGRLPKTGFFLFGPRQVGKSTLQKGKQSYIINEDENIKGHVFCRFLALVLRKELDRRLKS